MPEFVTGKVWEALNRAGKAVRGSRILVLGVAYKPNIDDVRESPALDIIRLLEGDGAEVLYHDPYVPRLEEDGSTWVGEELTDELLSSVDVAVIVTDHANVDHRRVFEVAPIVVDSRNATRGLVSPSNQRPHGGWIVKGPEG
jgi:UDP-N-acetyl-D-glucosamine dehydrogenase